MRREPQYRKISVNRFTTTPRRLANCLVEIMKYFEPSEDNDYSAIEKLLLLNSFFHFDFLVMKYYIFFETELITCARRMQID